MIKRFITMVGLMLSFAEANSIQMVEGTLLHGATFDRVNIENIVTFSDDKNCRYIGIAKNEIAQGRVFVKLDKRICKSEEKVITGFVVEDDVSGLSVEESFEGKIYYATLKPFKKIRLVFRIEENNISSKKQ